ncbi:unnamed protein product, partial [Ceratitis capitata]
SHITMSCTKPPTTTTTYKHTPPQCAYCRLPNGQANCYNPITLSTVTPRPYYTPTHCTPLTLHCI